MKTKTQHLLQPVSPFLTKQGAADYLGGVSVPFVEDLIRSGQLPVSRISYKVLRISKFEIDKLMERTRSVGPLGSKAVAAPRTAAKLKATPVAPAAAEAAQS
jgi:excisionase family DNA binding protein